MLKVQERKRSR